MENNQADKVVSDIKKDFVAVGIHSVHGWYTWAVVGAGIGAIIAIAYVANLSGQFDASRASDAEGERVVAIEADPAELRIVSLENGDEFNFGNDFPSFIEVASFENDKPSSKELSFSYSRTGEDDFRPLAGAWDNAPTAGHSFFSPLFFVNLPNGEYDFRVTRAQENAPQEMQPQGIPGEQNVPIENSMPATPAPTEETTVGPQASAIAQASKWISPPAPNPLIPQNPSLPGQPGTTPIQLPGQQVITPIPLPGQQGSIPQYNQYPGQNVIIYAQVSVTVRQAPGQQIFADGVAQQDAGAGGNNAGAGGVAPVNGGAAGGAPAAGGANPAPSIEDQIRAYIDEKNKIRKENPYPQVSHTLDKSSESCDPLSIEYKLWGVPGNTEYPSFEINPLEPTLEKDGSKIYHADYLFSVEVPLSPTKNNIKNCTVRQYIKATVNDDGLVKHVTSNGRIGRFASQKNTEANNANLMRLADKPWSNFVSFPVNGEVYMEDMDQDGLSYSLPNVETRFDKNYIDKIVWEDRPGHPLDELKNYTADFDFVDIVIGMKCEPGPDGQECERYRSQEKIITYPAVAIKSHVHITLTPVYKLVYRKNEDGISEQVRVIDHGRLEATMTPSEMERVAFEPVDKNDNKHIKFNFCFFKDPDLKWVARDVIKHPFTSPTGLSLEWYNMEACLNPGEGMDYSNLPSYGVIGTVIPDKWY